MWAVCRSPATQQQIAHFTSWIRCSIPHAVVGTVLNRSFSAFSVLNPVRLKWVQQFAGARPPLGGIPLVGGSGCRCYQAAVSQPCYLPRFKLSPTVLASRRSFATNTKIISVFEPCALGNRGEKQFVNADTPLSGLRNSLGQWALVTP